MNHFNMISVNRRSLICRYGAFCGQSWRLSYLVLIRFVRSAIGFNGRSDGLERRFDG